MKTLEYIYQETQIHFLLNPSDKNVMVNATEMAKLFNRKTEKFLKSDHAKAFIDVANLHPNGVRIIENRGRNGIYFDRRLALKFAAWLSPEFEFWIYNTIDEIIFGNYKLHWDAHQEQISAKQEQERLEPIMLSAPTPEICRKYVDAIKRQKAAKNAKSNAIRNQYRLDLN